MYYLYEIPGVKIGVTQNLSRRQHEQKNKGELILLGVYEDIYQVSEIEREKQADKGYHVDKHPYWYTVTVQNPKSCTPEAILKQKQNNDPRKAAIGTTRKLSYDEVVNMRERYSNDISLSAADLARELGISVASATYALKGRTYSEYPGATTIRIAKTTCEKCGKVLSFTNYKRWHGVKCSAK